MKLFCSPHQQDLTEMPNFSAFFDDSVDMLDHLMTYMKKTNTFDDDFTPLETYLEKAKGFMKETKAFLGRQNDKLAGKMQENENKLEKLKNMVQSFEENQAEL